MIFLINNVLKEDFAKLRATHALVPYVPSTLRVLMLHVPHALCAPVPHVSRAMHVLVLDVPRAFCTLVSYLPCCLRALTPYGFRTLRAVVLTCFT